MTLGTAEEKAKKMVSKKERDRKQEVEAERREGSGVRR